MGGEAPQRYDQTFFLALAAKGKNAWNAWRRADKSSQVTFAYVDFSETPRDEINFEGFEFGDYADFSNCKWRGLKLEEWVRGSRVFDFRAFQPGRAVFTNAAFGRGASFNRASFGDWASFFDVTFRQDACFTGATFGEHAMLNGAAFGLLPDFTSATFGNGASFTGAAFGLGGNKFTQTHFKGYVAFNGQSQEEWTRIASLGMGAEAFREMKRRHEESWQSSLGLTDSLSGISFAGALFDGEADFSGRSYEGGADFTGARFYYPPNFNNITSAGLIDFTGARIGFGRPMRFHWTSDTKIPVRLRFLRKIAEETKNHDLERDLYIEERKAERGVYLRQLWDEQKKAPWTEQPLIAWRLFGHLCWIVIMLFYWVLGNYGRSFVLPAAWLCLSVPCFHRGYDKILAPLMSEMSTLASAKYANAIWMVALGNAVPFVGPVTVDGKVKEFLFCPSGSADCLPPIPSEGYQLLVLGQNLLSLILFFFIGLALRNYFKVK